MATAAATTETRKAQAFAFKPNGRAISAADAEILGRRFVELAGDGAVTPAQIVEDARRPSSPLHRFFDWDDASAAEKHRLAHARSLVTSVSIEITYTDGTRERTRALHSVIEDDDRGYVPMPRTMATEDLRAQVVAAALRELEAWSARYSRYESLAESVAIVRKAAAWLRDGGRP